MIPTDELSPEARKQLASELSGQLAEALKPEREPLKLGLWQIEAELAGLLDLREQAVEDGELPETLAAIDSEIASYHSREVRKVNGTCAAIRGYLDAAGESKKEADRLYDRAKRLEARADLIKANALKAMQAHGVRSLETPTNRLRIQKNGGLEPLDIPEWPRDSSGDFKLLPAGYILPGIPLKTFVAPDTTALRQQLKLGPVPSARLLQRGEHLRCE